MSLLSVCIIGRNEEKYIEKCLLALKNYDVEIVYVDTGSTDRTLDIARKYADIIGTFTWCDDFSAARNYCIGLAKNDWILVVDCDEVVTSIDMDKLVLFMERNQKTAGRILLNNPYMQSGVLTNMTERLTRLFNRKIYHYEGSVHEQVMPITIGKEPACEDIPVIADHYGYGNDDPTIMKAKAERNIRLLLKELDKNEQDPYLYYQIGQSYYAIGEYEDALTYLEKGLGFDIDPKLDWVQKLVEAYGYTLINLKRYDDALALEGLEPEFGVTADYYFIMGLVYMNLAQFDAAVNAFLLATEAKKYHVEGAGSYMAYYNIGVIYEVTGHKKEALEFYTRCGDFAPALNRKEAL